MKRITTIFGFISKSNQELVTKPPRVLRRDFIQSFTHGFEVGNKPHYVEVEDCILSASSTITSRESSFYPYPTP